MPCSAFDPAVRMALAPFRRERAVKKILLVKALPLRVVLLYRTAGWNARLFRKSLCKRLCKSLKTLSSAGGRPFRRSSGAPLEASQALPGPGIFAMTWRGSAAVWRRQCPACPSAANLACGGKPPERRNRSPSAEGKSHGASSRLHRLRRCIGGGSPLC